MDPFRSSGASSRTSPGHPSSGLFDSTSGGLSEAAAIAARTQAGWYAELPPSAPSRPPTRPLSRRSSFSGVSADFNDLPPLSNFGNGVRNDLSRSRSGLRSGGPPTPEELAALQPTRPAPLPPHRRRYPAMPLSPLMPRQGSLAPPILSPVPPYDTAPFPLIGSSTRRGMSTEIDSPLGQSSLGLRSSPLPPLNPLGSGITARRANQLARGLTGNSALSSEIRGIGGRGGLPPVPGTGQHRGALPSIGMNQLDLITAIPPLGAGGLGSASLESGSFAYRSFGSMSPSSANREHGGLSR